MGSTGVSLRIPRLPMPSGMPSGTVCQQHRPRGGGGVSKALRELTNNNTENHNQAEKVGAIEAVVVAMRAHRENARVQEIACEALRNNLRALEEPALGGAQGRHRGCGGGDARAQGERRAATEGVQALYNLAEIYTENQRRAGKAGAVEAVVAAVRAHKKSEAEQLNACQALQELAANDTENQDRAGKAGAIEAVVMAMCTHKENE